MPVSIQIDDKYLNQVKSVLAHPLLSENLYLSDEEIKEYSIFPALYRYYIKFPIQESVQLLQNTTEMVIPFPDDETIGVIDVRTVGKTGFGTRQGSNSDFWRVVRYNQEFRGARFRSTRSNRSFNPEGLKYMFMAQQQMIDAMTNNLETFRHEVNYAEKKVYVFSTVVAQLLIVWAKMSYDFNKVKPTQIFNVIDLSKAYLLRHLATVGSLITDQSSEKQINSDALNSLAERLEDKVFELWNEFPDVVALRFS